jgi:hypothetical protein
VARPLGHLDAARQWCSQFFDYYNHVHRHRALGLHTPASVHYGTAAEVRAQRAQTLNAAYATNPEHFSTRPVPPKLPTVAWINEPEEALIQNISSRRSTSSGDSTKVPTWGWNTDASSYSAATFSARSSRPLSLAHPASSRARSAPAGPRGA